MVFKMLGKFLLHRDVFGEPIHIAYKGHETYRTVPGSILTLVMQGLTLAYMIIKIVEVASMSDP